MKHRKQRSIHRTLLRAHLTVILAALALMAAIFFIWQQRTLRESMRASLTQTCRTVAINVDREIRQMDAVSVNVLYSNLVKENFARYSEPAQTGGPQKTGKNDSAAILADVLTAVAGADRTVRQINLYNNSGGGFGMGMYNGFLPEDAAKKPWFEATKALSGKKYISQPETNAFLSRYGAASGQRYLSLCRQYFNVYNQPEGFVEVVQYYDAVFATAIEPEGSYSPRVAVYDGDGRMLFPAEPGEEFYDYLPGKTDSVAQLRNPATGRMEYVAYSELPRSGFTVAVALDGAQYYAPMVQFALTLLLVLALVVALCFISVYGVTRKISAPLVKICAYLSGLNFQRRVWKPLPAADSGIAEIGVLCRAINRFQERLQESLEKNMLLQKQELQSQMLALQSQMNPHFLYNSLATVSAMAEEGMVDEIGEMCSNITDILRYISSNRQQLVPLEDELENTSRYLGCLRLRFGQSLTYDIAIPDEMLDIRVPKLCIQLLVENAVKFITPLSPPWQIHIQGELAGGIWIVSVQDNGRGFTPEAEKKLREKMAQVYDSKLLPSLELNGMGLMNIYIRLRLLYREAFVFEIGNLPAGGASVTIGGKADVSDQTV